MKKLKALHTTTGNYGTIPGGGVFECEDEIAEHLIEHNIAVEVSDAITHVSEKPVVRVDADSISGPFNREVIQGKDEDTEEAEGKPVPEDPNLKLSMANEPQSTDDTNKVVAETTKVEEPDTSKKEEKAKPKTKEEKGPITTKDLK